MLPGGYKQGTVSEELSGRRYQGGAVRKGTSVRSCLEIDITGAVRKEISVRSCQERDIREELL